MTELSPKKCRKILKKIGMPEDELINFPGGKPIKRMRFGKEGVYDGIAFNTAVHWWEKIRPLHKKKKRRRKKRQSK